MTSMPDRIEEFGYCYYLLGDVTPVRVTLDGSSLTKWFLDAPNWTAARFS